jgi:hypothetical protein
MPPRNEVVVPYPDAKVTRPCLPTPLERYRRLCVVADAVNGEDGVKQAIQLEPDVAA